MIVIKWDRVSKRGRGWREKEPFICVYILFVIAAETANNDDNDDSLTAANSFFY